MARYRGLGHKFNDANDVYPLKHEFADFCDITFSLCREKRIFVANVMLEYGQGGSPEPEAPLFQTAVARIIIKQNQNITSLPQTKIKEHATPEH
jgi:hypothetical protein